MKYFLIIFIILYSNSTAEELQVKAESFYADEKKGISVFKGHVNIIKGFDELNASKVTIYTNKKNEPIKFLLEDNASFSIRTKENSIYTGKANKVIYFPKTKEYHFYKNVHLTQINEKKEILGEEVVLKTIEGKAYAKGAKSEPVIMIFNIPKKKGSIR